MPDIVLWIIAFIVVLGPLILIHEFGHFIAAKMIGVTVLEFGIGFPPRALKLFERGGTEFTLNWLPIGGFVRPLGEDFVKPLGENATDADRAAFEQRMAERTALEKRNVKTKSLMEAGPWQRIWFMSAGVVFNVIFGFLIFALVGLTGLPRPQVDLLIVTPGSPADKAGLKAGDTIFGLNGVEIETLRDIDDEIGNRIAKPIDLEVWRAGKTFKVTVEPAEVGLISGSGVFVTELVKGAPAELAGMKLGDRVVKVDDTFIASTKELLDYNSGHRGKEVTVVLERESQQITIKLTPRQSPPSGQGPIGATITEAAADPSYGFLMVSSPNSARTRGIGFGESLSYGWKRTTDTLGLIGNIPTRILRGQATAEEVRPASIVAISQIGGSIIQKSFQQQVIYPILDFAALLSVFIGVTQLLPIPGLDGGRIIFVIAELLRGKPINQEREGLIHMAGIIFLLGLTVIIVMNDIINPIALPK